MRVIISSHFRSTGQSLKATHIICICICYSLYRYMQRIQPTNCNLISIHGARSLVEWPPLAIPIRTSTHHHYSRAISFHSSNCLFITYSRYLKKGFWFSFYQPFMYVDELFFIFRRKIFFLSFLVVFFFPFLFFFFC